MKITLNINELPRWKPKAIIGKNEKMATIRRK
jgi:hypothetical protein